MMYDLYYDYVAEARAQIMTQLNIDYNNEDVEAIIEEELFNMIEAIKGDEEK